MIMRVEMRAINTSRERIEEKQTKQSRSKANRGAGMNVVALSGMEIKTITIMNRAYVL